MKTKPKLLMVKPIVIARLREKVKALRRQVAFMEDQDKDIAALLKTDTLPQRSSEDLLAELAARPGPEGEIGRAGLLALRKTADYDNGLPRDRYFPLGLSSYAQMIHIKSERLLSFSRSAREALNEPVMDTLHDLINYASFAADWMRRQA